MKGKTVLITGGVSGIGRASAISFAKEGTHVFIIDINDAESGAVLDEIKRLGGKAFYYHADVSNEAEVSGAVSECVRQFGTLDFAHNNAGIAISRTTVNCTEEIWTKIIDTNLKGYWLCMKYELLQMQQQGHGSIVNTSSISGLI
ncbi:MAG: SDR family NAD(P)-dependent oxidoreductase, partial [Clostridiales bacterium]|nr:SDR family NAD(P)-dependent oxidoreductase [Clostridiales bacterium]